VLAYTLAGLRGAVLGWGLGLAALGAYILAFYDTLAAQSETLQQLLRQLPRQLPRELLAFFGDVERFATPAGYLETEYFSYLPLLLGTYAVLVGSSLIAELEERGLLDLFMSAPVSRLAFLLGRWLGFSLASLGIVVLGWLGLVLGRPLATRLTASPLALAGPFVSLLAQVLLFGALALALSQVLPARRLAAMAAGLGLGASFFLTGLGRVVRDLEAVARFSPLTYYQGGAALDGLRGDWLAGLCGATVALLALAGWRFQRRDLRVSGEGDWPWPRRRPRSPTVPKG
jgi:ABC-type transport system involved in multi-copper enzyme maturation permease subunit